MQKIIIKTISANDPLFPKPFKTLQKSKIQSVKQFYAAGNLKLLEESPKNRPRLGVVGSRKLTPYGKTTTADLAGAAAGARAIIVSGLALGVDSIAHKAALEAKGSTIAVLPSSISNIYPASHNLLAKQIIEGGGLLISEFSGTEPPMKHHFIQRNRLIAALSDVLLVTEATVKSGTRHTVDFITALGKPIMAVPGDINRQSSAGPNRLIKDGCEPILSSSDLLASLGLTKNSAKLSYQPHNKYEAYILNHLFEKPFTFNELVAASLLEVNVLSFHLTALEIRGVIESNSNNVWRVIS